MAQSSALRRAYLEDAYEASKASGRLLREQFRLWLTAARKPNANGSIATVSVSEASTSFSQSGRGQITAAETVELWQFLIDLHDDLVVRDSLDPSDNAAMFAALNAELRAQRSVTEVYPDFSLAR